MTIVTDISPATWTPDEIAILRDLYPRTTSTVVAAHLGRTTNSVRSKAATLGLRSGHNPLADLPRIPIPIYPHPDYCTACGLSFQHLPGCPNTGDGLPVIPTAT
jgi:hypothetical protein